MLEYLIEAATSCSHSVGSDALRYDEPELGGSYEIDNNRSRKIAGGRSRELVNFYEFLFFLLLRLNHISALPHP